ncbi:aminodeoxychorismate synthase component I [Stakelama sp. CBK3Z-3]|uniref:Aminodeoxychorismate synthase component I n=1 Tax=Stakelama flava TaxID=2860338 RepID=A0ABS6XKL9_9SPHN|nr:aminodeoxychorismate synthase component I [Stakelama flava]MBW4330755.1 aminodeoxychorismate synthase component I [Stakelama flava]
MTLTDAPPYVLLDDARPGGGPARLYADLVQVVTTHRVDGVRDALAKLRRGLAGGLHAAGFLSYEAGAAFEARAPMTRHDSTPLLWFGLFERWREIDSIAALLPDPRGAWIGAARPEIDFAAYCERAEQVAQWIAAGDIYQANLTFRANVSAMGDPLALYAALRDRAQAGYGAVIETGEATIVSLSPELFFALNGRRLAARPMKGTAPRGVTPKEDERLARALAADPKQRAENLMILDLMRNDLGRIAMPGSVRVPERFAVETYPTVHQMVSGVTATLAPEQDAIDALAALFPCGSITGAPKIRAMQVIEEVECESARGPYTGAIGRIDAGGDACFSVAIRTLWRQGASPFSIGLGSGYVADSLPAPEWRECLAKGAFLTKGQRSFDLMETMAFDPQKGVALLERHLARLKNSAGAFDFAFDRHVICNELQAATFRQREPARIRLLLSPSGNIAMQIDPMPAMPRLPVSVALAPLPVSKDDFRLRHKTTDRAFYDAARIRGGAFETLFLLPDGTVSEGSFTSLFVPRGDRLVTPPVKSALPGVLRTELIESGRAVEAAVHPEDLAHEFFIGNALRGLIRAQLVADTQAAV